MGGSEGRGDEDLCAGATGGPASSFSFPLPSPSPLPHPIFFTHSPPLSLIPILLFLPFLFIVPNLPLPLISCHFSHLPLPPLHLPYLRFPSPPGFLPLPHPHIRVAPGSNFFLLRWHLFLVRGRVCIFSFIPHITPTHTSFPSLHQSHPLFSHSHPPHFFLLISRFFFVHILFWRGGESVFISL